MIQSMSRKGNCWDNARWKAALARSKPNSCTTLAIQPGSCRHDLFAYIEGYYNRQRLHSASGISLPNRQSAKPLDPVSTKSGEGQFAVGRHASDRVRLQMVPYQLVWI